MKLKKIIGSLLIVTAPIIVIAFWAEISHWFNTPYEQYNAVLWPFVYACIAMPLGFGLVSDSKKEKAEKAEKRAALKAALAKEISDYDEILNSLK